MQVIFGQPIETKETELTQHGLDTDEQLMHMNVLMT